MNAKPCMSRLARINLMTYVFMLHQRHKRAKMTMPVCHQLCSRLGISTMLGSCSSLYTHYNINKSPLPLPTVGW